MGTQDWIRMMLSILSGVAVCIPLVAALIRYVQKAVKEKNRNQPAGSEAEEAGA